MTLNDDSIDEHNETIICFLVITGRQCIYHKNVHIFGLRFHIIKSQKCTAFCYKSTIFKFVYALQELCE